MTDWGLVGQGGAVGLLEGSLQRDQVPHALLFAGPQGTGKHTAAGRMAARLLCAAGPQVEPCGQCPPCRHFRAGTAPDFIDIEAGEGEEIRIDRVRELGRQAQLTAQESPRRVVRLDPAEALNTYAANALLKLLEEPPGEVAFLLISHRPEGLLPTIRSRCQLVPFRPVPVAEVETWLAREQELTGEDARLAARLAGGAPGQALHWAERAVVEERNAVLESLEAVRGGGGQSLVETAERWAGAEVAAWLPYLEAWLQDLARVRVSSGQVPAERLVNFDRSDRLHAQSRRLGAAEAAQLVRAAARLREAVNGRANTRLAVEDFLVAWRWPAGPPLKAAP
ncbi:MAG TPA: DNA polymerase III subunit delta' [Gammaproteobacteria bacterium]|nr:DNA polymerase III subunit delta' [Gammaproteobacteria bacterium]